MQGIVADIRVSVLPGQTLAMPAPPGTYRRRSATMVICMSRAWRTTCWTMV